MPNNKSEITSKVLCIRNAQTLRQRACQNIEKGPVTSGFAEQRRGVISLLNEALAAEFESVLRSKPHLLATGTHSDPIRVRAGTETAHLDRLAQLILDLGGEPNFSPNLTWMAAGSINLIDFSQGSH